MKLPPERLGFDAPADMLAARALMSKAATERCWRAAAPPVEETLRGVRVLRFRPAGRPTAVVLHFHGGGYRLGCPEYLAPFATALSARCQVEVICPAYRLAPEHPYPAALYDARAVLLALTPTQAPCILSGDSAGGGIAAALTMLALSDAVPLRGLILLSAWLDLRLSALSYVSNASTDPLFSLSSAKLAADAYLQGVSALEVLASPLLGSLAGFPPTFISVGSGEVLADDSSRFKDALNLAGARATLLEITGMTHIAAVRDLSAPGAMQTFNALGDYIDARISNPD